MLRAGLHQAGFFKRRALCRPQDGARQDPALGHRGASSETRGQVVRISSPGMCASARSVCLQSRSWQGLRELFTVCARLTEQVSPAWSAMKLRVQICIQADHFFAFSRGRTCCKINSLKSQNVLRKQQCLVLPPVGPLGPALTTY